MIEALKPDIEALAEEIKEGFVHPSEIRTRIQLLVGAAYYEGVAEGRIRSFTDAANFGREAYENLVLDHHEKEACHAIKNHKG